MRSSLVNTQKTEARTHSQIQGNLPNEMKLQENSSSKHASQHIDSTLNPKDLAHLEPQ